MTEIADRHAKWDEWVAAGLLTSEQVGAIGEYERTRLQGESDADAPAAAEVAPNESARRALSGAVPEALGYLGGLLVLGGSVALLGRVWEDIVWGGRVAIAAVAAVLLGLGGAFTDERVSAARARLRAVLWTGSTAGTGIAIGLAAAEGITEVAARTVVLLTALGVGIHAGALWAGRSRPLQLTVHLIAWPVVIGSAVAHVVSTSGQGLAIWVVGAVLAWLGLYLIGRCAVLWVLIGAGAALVGAGFVATARAGIGLGFALATALGLLALGMWRGAVTRSGPQLAVTILGGVSVLQIAPTAIGYFTGQAGVMTGVTVWMLGACVVGLAIKGWLRAPRVCEAIGAGALVVGAAVMATQVTAVALSVGLVTAVGLLAIGTRPERVAASIIGAVGLLVFVPWTISHFFPGEGRVPVLVTVTGALILAVSVYLLRRRA